MRLPLVALALVLAGCASTSGNPAPLPDGVAVLGDSISRAMNTAGDAVGDHPQASWATGADPADAVTSHLERLRARQPGVEVVGFNDARSGARMADLQRQAESAVEQKADYVLILMGANDACAGSLDAMTTVDEFRADLREALRILRDGLPENATVYVVSIPDVGQIPERAGGNRAARMVWAYAGVCHPLLDHDATEEERAAVRERVMAYNQALREEAARVNAHFDDEAVFRSTLEAADLSPVDYFHPSLRGQQRLADVAWDAGPFASPR